MQRFIIGYLEKTDVLGKLENELSITEYEALESSSDTVLVHSICLTVLFFFGCVSFGADDLTFRIPNEMMFHLFLKA